MDMMDAAAMVSDLREARRRAAGLLLGLDFDGTLAPIVARPEDAALPARVRPVLESLARRPDTRVAVISGRALADLTGRVGVAGVYYAGNHGLEIDGPDVRRMHPAADAARDQIAALGRELERVIDGIDGATVEDKGLTLSVHYRRVRDEHACERLRRAVRATAVPHAGIRLSEGKKVIEIRPDVDWNKGRALRFLRETIEAATGPTPAVFIGDDRTDEDAFRELGPTDFAIVVGDPPPPGTAARAFLPDTEHVAGFLERLARP